MTASAVAVAYNLGLVVRRKEAPHTVLEHKEEVVAHKAPAEAVHRMKEAAVPIVAHKEIEVARMAAAVVATDPAAAVGLGHTT